MTDLVCTQCGKRTYDPDDYNMNESERAIQELTCGECEDKRDRLWKDLMIFGASNIIPANKKLYSGFVIPKDKEKALRMMQILLEWREANKIK